MKYTHDRREYEVAELISAVKYAAKKLSWDQQKMAQKVFAAAALIERHEKQSAALEKFENMDVFELLGVRTSVWRNLRTVMLRHFDTMDPFEIDRRLSARAALRGEEDARREN